MLGALSNKLEPKDVQPAAAVLIERIEATPPAAPAFPGLSEAVASLSDKLEPESLQTVVALLNRRLRTQGSEDHDLGKVWVIIERKADAQLDNRKRIQMYVDLLRSPVVVGKTTNVPLTPQSVDTRKSLLDGLEKITGRQFEGDLWRFVDWATTAQEGKSLHLDLGN